MTRVLMIGDSNAARLVNAMREVFAGAGAEDPALDGIVFDPVCATGPVAGKLRIRDGMLRLGPKPAKWNHYRLTEDHVDALYSVAAAQIAALAPDGAVPLGGYDLVLAFGGWLVRDWPIVARAQAAGSWSAACLDQLAADRLAASGHVQWLGGASRSGEGLPRILSLPEPLRNELAPDYLPDAAAKALDFPAAFACLRRAGARMGLEIVPLPPELLNAAGNATAARFRRGQGADFGHLNNEGSMIYLHHILSLLRDRTGMSLPEAAS